MNDKSRQIDERLNNVYVEIANIVGLVFMEESLERFLDITEDYLINAYVSGARDTLEELGEDSALIDEINIVPGLRTALEKERGGLTYRNRVILGFFDYSPEQMKRLVTNEYHRLYNSGAYEMAKSLEESGKNIGKKWHTMKDDKVRDTHVYLEGEVVPLDEYFFTFDGDSALYPGDFSQAENNIGCRCRVTYEEV